MINVKIEEVSSQIKAPVDNNMFDSWNRVLPEYEPRRSQIAVMDWINGLDPAIKHVLIEVPVGGGKSPLALAYSAYVSGGMGNSFILTPQKTLQRQYETSFNRSLLASFYGKGNYTCEQKNTTCDVGSDISPECSDCPAKLARDVALASPNVVMNYNLALSYFSYASLAIPKRDLMVFDEAHTLESNLINFSAVTFSEQKAKRYNAGRVPSPRSMKEAIDWIQKKYVPSLESFLSKLKKQVAEIEEKNRGSLTKEEVQIVKTAFSTADHLIQVMKLIDTPLATLENNYVLVCEKSGFIFKHLYGKNNFKSIILPKADRFLYMSSTILDKEGFCSDLGIDPREAAMISIDSEFPVENRQVIYAPTAKMNYGWNTPERSFGRQQMIKKINHICKYHKDESGVIHTGSFQISQWLLDNIKTDHKIIHHNPMYDITRDDAIEEFIQLSEKQPTLLISPSVTEGLDLINDKGRFGIIVKMPYPFLGDMWVKKRMELSKQWYNRQTITGVIQACGRVVRSKDDWGVVYILDECFEGLYNQTKKIIPIWWKNALTVI